MKKLAILFIILFIPLNTFTQNDRAIWVKELTKMAKPVLEALANDRLKETMPVEQGSFEYGDRSRFASLEAFGRLMAGIAPWLELGADDTEEGKLRKKFIDLSLKSIEHAVNPKAKDFMNFNKGAQPLVDAAFLAQAFLRAPTQLWDPLSESTKQRVINAFKSSKAITPNYNNWLLFSATIEAFFMKFDKEADAMRIDYALKKHMEWYIGDGLYADGKYYHWDYYNSFVIHPMLIDIITVLQDTAHPSKNLNETILKRAQRYGAILERQISPEGTYPIVGRSAIYRFGTFQLLSQLALLEKLPEDISEAQVRAALTKVLIRLHQSDGVYNKQGWLQIGIAGHQPKMAEPYICTGSLYLTALGFLSLGLPENHSFWISKSEPWSMVKIWSGDPSVKRDSYKN